jgi:hypothetical protein
MQLLNATKMQARYTLGIRPDGRERVVVVVKGTFTIPRDDQRPQLAEKQVPLVEADVFTGEPGLSAPLYESDYAPHKPRCDVLLNGSAYAPGGRPAERVTVSLRVGSLVKSFVVVGKRSWQPGLLHFSPSKPEPFVALPISYDNAFGGVDRADPDPAMHRWYPTNHAGVGYAEQPTVRSMEGKQVPNTEEAGQPITKPNGTYRPMGLGPVGRGWQPRASFAGTYDQNWLANVCPFLPSDFKEEYFQAAPTDQQIDFPQGGEEVELIHLTPQGRTTFRLPRGNVPVEFFLKGGDTKPTMAVLDTIVLEPNLGRFLLSWRSSLPLRRNLFEVPLAVVGKMSRGWYRARRQGKVYHASLQDLVASRQPSGAE